MDKKPDNRLSILTADGAAQYFGGHWWRFRSDGTTGLPLFVQVAEVDGALVCTQIAVGGRVPMAELRRVTTTDLREIRIGAITDAIGQLFESVPKDPVDRVFADRVRAIGAERTRHVELKRPGRRGYSPAQYEEWANDYREAVVTHPRRPIPTLADKWSVAEKTVRKRLRRARALGVLRPAPVGRAGETPRD